MSTTYTVTVTREEWQRDRAAIRHAARYDARGNDCNAYEVRAPDGAVLHRCALRPLLPTRPARPRPARILTPEAVEAAYLAHGPGAHAVLNCSRQAISGDAELRAARNRAYAARGEAVPRGTGRPKAAYA